MSLPPILLLAILATVGLLAAAVFDVGPPRRSRLVKRARALGDVSARAQAQARSALRRPAEGRFDGLLRRLLPRPAVVQARLDATGHKISLTHYGAACLAVAVVSGGVTLSLGVPGVLAFIEGLASGIWLPHAAVGLLMARRKARFFKTFPEAIGLMVRGLRAGLPIAENIAVVGREVIDPVGEEFRRIADQVRLGQPLQEAMSQASARINLPEFNFLAISMAVQRETGGNLAETLENLEIILRRRQQMRLKIKAMSSEAAASALLIGALPFVMAGLMWFTSGHYVSLLLTDPMGHMMILGGLASLAIGGFVMRQMTRFEI